MQLNTIPELLALSPATDWAVPHFNCHNAELVCSVLRAAEAEQSPVIISIGPQTINYLGLKSMASLIRAMGEESMVPVAFHLDHAKSLELVKDALAVGFSSVMFDGSALEYEENIRLTAQMVAMAHDAGASAEGEVGIVPHGEAKVSKDLHTNPAQAIEYAQRTGVDLLAVSVGSSHNMRSQNATLDVDLIASIFAETGVPLVLHGGSGVVDQDIALAVQKGLRKVNINTALKMAFIEGLTQALSQDTNMDMLPLMETGMQKASTFVTNRIRLCRSEGRVA